eukprot:1737875-Prymnesium_polylepis.1
MGVDGLAGNKWGFSGEKPTPHSFLSQNRSLNDHLVEATEGALLGTRCRIRHELPYWALVALSGTRCHIGDEVPYWD